MNKIRKLSAFPLLLSALIYLAAGEVSAQAAETNGVPSYATTLDTDFDPNDPCYLLPVTWKVGIVGDVTGLNRERIEEIDECYSGTIRFTQRNTCLPPGFAVEQNPNSGATSSTLTVVLSGTDRVAPNLVGSSYKQAWETLASCGLEAEFVPQAFFPEGEVSSTSPPANGSLNGETELLVRMAKLVAVPSTLVGMTQKVATDNLVAAGLRVGTVTTQKVQLDQWQKLQKSKGRCQYVTGRRENVLKTRPTKGQLVNLNSAVALIVELRPSLVTDPEICRPPGTIRP